MARKAADMQGKRFGRWTVLRPGKNDSHHKWWWVRCDCGTEKQVPGGNLRSGQSLSCGCYLREKNRETMKARYEGNHPAEFPGYAGTHLHTAGKDDYGRRLRSRTYNTWQAMRKRCNNPNASNYKYYGGRGITVDPRWDRFENFLEDMGLRPEGRTLDRVDPDGPYTKENCRWATPKQQTANRRKRS